MAKRAPLVGISDYPGTQNDLQGCVNDITNVYDVLVKYFGHASTDIALRADDVYGEPLRLRRIAGRTSPEHVLWAACRSDQYSADADVGGKPGGAFTYFLCRHIRDTAGRITRGELLKRVRASLKHEGFWQVPQLECTADRKVQRVFA